MSGHKSLTIEDLKGLEAKFWEKVDKVSGDCWEWTAAKNQLGYGRLTIRYKSYGATHVAWLLQTGNWPTGSVLHKCDNPPCVRAEHLFIGNQVDNMRDAARKGRTRGTFVVKDFCKYGHKMAGDNLGYINSSSKGKQLRYCKACSARTNLERREYKHQWYINNKSKVIDV